jgi:ribosomal protein S18 acetylase RimI-like enzyme
MSSKFSYLIALMLLAHVCGFSVPLGLGAVLFRPQGLYTKSAYGDANMLLKASDFFVDAFWVGKVGGGADVLTSKQRQSLSTTQFKEFRGRYAGVSRGQSELLICQLPSGEVVGCAGVEVTPIPKGKLRANQGARSPLMSNLAVSHEYRRKGIAEKLVKEAERVARYEWGYDDIFLYVEERNVAAVKLYQKLGYRKIWADDEATTLLPTTNGKLKTAATKIVCMKKRLDKGLFGRLLPF